ncbi:MAG: DUF366 family protein [Candidatus Latescibacteria bacterium]|nr:DUF366 family protein [Candidatus Latescibacterota bacterium]NIM66449.1 DUF366 family protein [Candidatus Latescibacterota bacterium]NIO02929.1 DUF366 family protein [Candidatus Latescibacterota bacterium]NIO30064.1 DUF366 family protein [Candidatus Latescibacterota bacterium]NIO57679.1 DUF366 family protein [Candidatus Latescibacterota bacterium]
MDYRILNESIPYTGRELCSGWVAGRTGLSGDAAVAFVGRCDVAAEDLVDVDDAKAGAVIRSEQMAHIIVEHPSCPLQTAILRQRLLVCILCEILGGKGHPLRREGDDVYVEDRKLTVSIAAPSSSGALIHLGINVRPEGAPVPAIGLEEMGVMALPLLRDLLDRYKKEVASCEYAETKVRYVP